MASTSLTIDRENKSYDVKITWGKATTVVGPFGRYTLVGEQNEVIHGDILDARDPHGQACLKVMKRDHILPRLIKT